LEYTYIDSHAHLYLPEFDADREQVVNRAIQAGVNKILLPNIDSRSIDGMMQMTSAFPGICYSMIGLHPTSVKENFLNELSLVESELKSGNSIAVGEIGIDLYWDKSRFTEQEEAFRTQLDLALRYKLPVAIHARESFMEILGILKDYRGKGLEGVFHAFTGTNEIARQLTGMGFHLGIGGILTYKNSELPEVIRETELDYLILETDSPYLAPVPKRGMRNESSYIPYIAEAIQRIKNVPLEQVADKTTQNALQLFFPVK